MGWLSWLSHPSAKRQTRGSNPGNDGLHQEEALSRQRGACPISRVSLSARSQPQPMPRCEWRQFGRISSPVTAAGRTQSTQLRDHLSRHRTTLKPDPSLLSAVEEDRQRRKIAATVASEGHNYGAKPGRYGLPPQPALPYPGAINGEALRSDRP